MQNMKKLKEDALRRKHEFEEQQRIEELQKQRKMGGGHGQHRSKRRDEGQNRSRKRKEQSAAPATKHQHKKPKKTPARWVLDTLLVLGTLIALVALFNPY